VSKREQIKIQRERELARRQGAEGRRIAIEREKRRLAEEKKEKA